MVLGCLWWLLVVVSGCWCLLRVLDSSRGFLVIFLVVIGGS